MTLITTPLIYPRLRPSNSVPKNTTSPLDNLIETSTESNICRSPRHRYNLRYNRNPTPCLASTDSSLLRHHTQYLSSDSLLSHETIQASNVYTAFSQHSSISAFIHNGYLFSRPTSQNPSVLSSNSHLININLTTDQNSTPPTINHVHYPLIVNITLVSSPRQDLQFLYLATQKINYNTQISDERLRKEFHRLDATNLEVKFENTLRFHNKVLIQFRLIPL